MKKWFAVLLALCLLTGVFALAETAIANPWAETTAEAIEAEYGYRFAEPESAENVIYRVMADEGLAEMQFDLDGAALTARVMAGEESDISGAFYESWDVEDSDAVGGFEATVRRVTEDGQTIDVCSWYDAEQAVNYCVMAKAADLDGFDIVAVALQVFPAAD